MTNQELLRALKEYVNSDLVDVELNPRKRIAIEAIAEAEKQEPHSWYSAELDEWMTEKTRKDHERLNSYTHKVGGFDLALYTTPPAKQEQSTECVGEPVENRFVRELREYGKTNQGAYLFPSWDIHRALKYLHGYTTPQPKQEQRSDSDSEHTGEPVAHTAVFNCPNCEYPHRVFTHITGAAQSPWEVTTPQPIGFAVMERPWVGLTDEEIEMIVENKRAAHWEFIRQVEAKLKEKNNEICSKG